ncbi:MAG: glycine cleavage system protein GcvH [Tissierellia bacterium]|nr:glycine cleavage system protein GcvH [Tissierellia bacterium]
MNVKDGLFYTEDHEWLEKDGDAVYLGIADYAQSQLGDVVYVELPEEDDEFDQGDSVASVESVKAASEVFTPVAGTVVEVNEALEDEPELLNEAPYDNWIVKLKLEDASVLDELMDADAYKKFVEAE